MGKKVGFGIHPTNLGLSAEIIAFMVATESVFGIAVDIDGLSVKGSTGNSRNIFTAISMVLGWRCRISAISLRVIVESFRISSFILSEVLTEPFRFVSVTVSVVFSVIFPKCSVNSTHYELVQFLHRLPPRPIHRCCIYSHFSHLNRGLYLQLSHFLRRLLFDILLSCHTVLQSTPGNSGFRR